MQVSLTATGGLERRLEVAIPAAEIDGEVAQRLNRISRTARLKGFRPGKAPIAMSPGSDLKYARSEEHTSEIQSLRHLVFRLVLEKTTRVTHIDPSAMYPCRAQ